MWQHAVSTFHPQQLKCMLVQNTNLAIGLSQWVQLRLHQGNKWNRATYWKQSSNKSLTARVKSMSSRLLNRLLTWRLQTSVQTGQSGNSHSPVHVVAEFNFKAETLQYINVDNHSVLIKTSDCRDTFAGTLYTQGQPFSDGDVLYFNALHCICRIFDSWRMREIIYCH